MKEARMGLDYDQLFPGRFLKAGEFQGKDVTLTINEIRLEELPQDRGGNRIRGIIGFKETKKELVLNRTNGECLKGMWGARHGQLAGQARHALPGALRRRRRHPREGLAGPRRAAADRGEAAEEAAHADDDAGHREEAERRAQAGAGHRLPAGRR
jgi:hypothetical protein